MAVVLKLSIYKIMVRKGVIAQVGIQEAIR